MSLTSLIQEKQILVYIAQMIMTPFRCAELASVYKVSMLLNQLEMITRYDCNWFFHG